MAGVAAAIRPTDTAEVRTRLASGWSARGSLLTASGTSALSLALRSTSTEASPLVALPAYACYDLATAADGANARVVLYDLDPLTLAPQPDSYNRAIGQKPSAVVVVHQFGIPVDVPALRALAERSRVVLIEDAAQGIGGRFQSRPLGAFGPLAVLSFGRGKGLTGGSGGALLATDESGMALLNRVAASLRAGQAGWSDVVRAGAQWLLARPWLYAIPASLPFLRLGETIYHEADEAHGLSRAATGVLPRVWDRSLEAAAVRRTNAAFLAAAARMSRFCQTIEVLPDAAPGYLRFPVLVHDADRAAVLDRRATELGIMPGYPRPLSQLKGFRNRCVNAEAEFPGAERLARSLITLPTHSLLTARDRDALADWLTHSPVLPASGRES